MPNFDEKAFASRILTELRVVVGNAWNSWTPDERAIIFACTEDAAKLAAKALVGIDVSAEKKQVEAQLAGIKVAGMASASGALWAALEKVLRMAVASLIKFP